MEGLLKALRTEAPLLLVAAAVFIATLVCFHANLTLPAHWGDTPVNWQNLAQKPHWATGRLVRTKVHEDNPERLTIYLEEVTGYQTTGMPKSLGIGVDAHRFANASLQIGQGVAVQVLLFPPEAPGYPGGRDFRPFSRYGAQVGHGYVMGRMAFTTLPTALKPVIPDWRAKIESFRTTISGKTSPLAQGVVAALLVGDMQAVPQALINAYRAAGLSHLLAISGMQLSVAGLGVFWLVRRLLASWPRLALTHNIRLYAAVIGLAVVPLYALVAGAGVSVIRAALMVSFFLLAVVAGRLGGALRAWALALIAMCLLWPESALTAGFQLSFAATLALILGNSAGLLSGHGILGHVRQIAVSSLLAGLGTLPLVAYIFGQVSLVSLPANLIAVPLMGGLGTWLSLIILALWPLGAGPLLLPALTWVCALTNHIAQSAAQLPQALVIIPQSFTLPLAGICLVAFLLLCNRNWLWSLAFTFAIFGLAWGASQTVSQPSLVLLDGGNLLLSRTQNRHYSVTSASKYDNVSAPWAQRWGYTLEPSKPQQPQCDTTGCSLQTPYGLVVTLTGAPTPDDCRRGILIIANQFNSLCPAKTFLKDSARWAYYP
jgi:competence protein ComEC